MGNMVGYETIKDALKAYRWQKIKQQKYLWLFFIFALCLLIISQFVINNWLDSKAWPNLNASFIILSNLSIGSFTGFFIYVLVDFLPKTEKKVKNRDSVYFNLYLISETIKSIEEKFLGDINIIKVKQYEALLYGYLVIDAKPEDLEAEESSKKTPYLNNKNVERMSFYLSMVNNQIDKLITAYGHDMENTDVEGLKHISDLKDTFMEIETDRNATNSFISVFISDFHCYGNLHLKHLLAKYSIYKYCNYNSERVKIDYKRV